MFTCFVCKTLHPNLYSIYRHIKFHHGLYPGKFLHLNCAEAGCTSVFGTYSGFKKHLVQIHGNRALSSSYEMAERRKEGLSESHSGCYRHAGVLHTFDNNLALSNEKESGGLMKQSSFVT